MHKTLKVQLSKSKECKGARVDLFQSDFTGLHAVLYVVSEFGLLDVYNNKRETFNGADAAIREKQQFRLIKDHHFHLD